MTSKNLFFNIMKEDLKRRLWTVALISLFFFFTFPISVAVMVSSYMKDMELMASGVMKTTAEVVRLQLFDQYAGWMSVENGFVATFIVVFAVVCGVTGFSYLHSKKKTDFFHSIPVKREKLFAASFINGILYTAVPYLISLLLAVTIVGVKTGVTLPWVEILGTYLFQMAFYTMIYATVILAVILTGNTIVSLLGMLVFCSWGPAFMVLIVGYCQEYFKTYYVNSNLMEQLIIKSSPFAWYVHSVSVGVSVSGVITAIVAAFILFVLSVVLYKLRPSEAAGRAMAFKKSEAVIKFMIVVPMSLFGSMVFRQMRSGENLWSIFGLICGCVITYCIIEIIYNFDFRRLFSHKIQLAVCGGVSLAVLAFFQFDLMRYDAYIPSKDKVESSALYSYDLNGDALYDYLGTPELIEERSGQHYLSISGISISDYLEEMQLENIDEVLFLAQAGINFNMLSEDENIRSGQMESGTIRYTMIDIKYHMKNGRDIYRSYHIPLQETEKQLETIYNTQEYKMTTYPVLKEGNPANYVGINYEECQDFSHIDFTDEAAKDALIAAYQEDLSALTYAVRRTESPIASLQFKTKELQGMIDIVRTEGNRYTSFNNWGYYPIYPSFTKTIAVLKECGINPGTFLNSDNVEKIELIGEDLYEDDLVDTYTTDMQQAVSESTYDSQGRNIMIIKDKAQIDEILNACIYNEYTSMNQLNESENRINVTAYVKLEPKNNNNTEAESFNKEKDTYSAEYDTYSLYFDQDKVPEFVKNRLLKK